MSRNNDLRPSDAFRYQARETFVREAEALYGTRRRLRAAAFAVAAAVLVGLGLWLALSVTPRGNPEDEQPPRTIAKGDTVWESQTDHARVISDAGARWEWPDARKIALTAGKIYLDVEPTGTPFQIIHKGATVFVHGTRLVVEADGDNLRVGLGSGEAKLVNEAGAVLLGPGEEGVAGTGTQPVKQEARRFSYLAGFIAECVDKTGDTDDGKKSEDFSYGVYRVPNGPGGTAQLGLVRYHLDVHIEDGMARTTIDQTFYNPSWRRVEGTFLFPLPPDASISRLAMYVNGTLMEGGMAQREHASQVYESIVRKMQDPAILEWMEGSTFRLRIFPFEPNAERRIILSYQQPLESLYELDRYRFPILKPSAPWEEFSLHVVIKEGTQQEITFPTYKLLEIAQTEGTVEFAHQEKAARPSKDLIIQLKRPRRPELDLASHDTGDERFFCVTATPEITGQTYRGPRRVLVIADRSGKISRAERRAQRRMARRLLRSLDRKDQIAVMAYSTKPRAWAHGFAPRTRENLAEAFSFLSAEEFFGAGDLHACFIAARDLFGKPREGDVIFYLGDGVDTISGFAAEQLALILPAKIRFMAIPVNRSFDRTLLGSLARRSGGRVIPVSPDDRIGWRAFDLVSSLRTPEWKELSWKLLDADGNPVRGVLHADRVNVRDGETFRIAGRIEGPWPRFLELHGEKRTLPERRTDCAWIPRLWAKLRIEALEQESQAEYRDEIVKLGTQYYVMTPFTSLLVLENEAMYKQYNIDRGRKDHWALYGAPKTWHGRAHKPTAGPIWTPNVWGDVWWDRRKLGNWDVNQAGFIPLNPGTGRINLNWAEGYEIPDFIRGDSRFDTIAPFSSSGVDLSSWDFADGYYRISGFSTRGLGLYPDGDGFANAFVYGGGGGGGGWGWGRLTYDIAGGDRFDNIFRSWAWSPSAVSFSPDGRRVVTGSSYGTVRIWDAATGRELPQLVALPLALGARHGESKRLEKFLPADVDLVAAFEKRCVVAFTGGERLLIDGNRITYLGEKRRALFDPLFDSVIAIDAMTLGEWSRVPWFLVPLKTLTAGAQVTERTAGEKTIVTIDRRGLTTIELVFKDDRPIETRIVLRGGTVVQRVVYRAWEDIAGHLLPTRAEFFGPEEKALTTVTYVYRTPGTEYRDRLQVFARALNDETATAAYRHLQPAIYYYQAGDRNNLENLLKRAKQENRATDAHRKLARLAAIRWGSDAVIDAPSLDPQAPEVKRWLPAEPLPVEITLEQSLTRGDLTALATLILGADEPEQCLRHVDRLKAKAPAGVRELLDLWSGELALRKGWKLKAYDAFNRAKQWQPIGENVRIHDRLSQLALDLNEAEKALKHAERALEIITSRNPTAPMAARYERLADIAARKPELKKQHARRILQRWAQVDPKNATPFQRLSAVYREAGDQALAVRYASHVVELTQSKAAYAKLATDLDQIGDHARAERCRTIAERLTR